MNGRQREVQCLELTHFKELRIMAKKKAAAPARKAAPRRKTAAKRELIDTGTDKRYVRRDAEGQFKESDDVGRSLTQDRKKKAKKASKPGQGDKGDRAR
jgi:hypothetical protein